MTADKLLSGTEAELEIHAELPHSKKYRKEMFRLLGCRNGDIPGARTFKTTAQIKNPEREDSGGILYNIRSEAGYP